MFHGLEPLNFEKNRLEILVKNVGNNKEQRKTKTHSINKYFPSKGGPKVYNKT